MKWRRFAGSNGSDRVGRRTPAAGVGGRAGLTMAVLIMAANAVAGQYDEYAAAGGDDVVVIGEVQPGQPRSVIVSDESYRSAGSFIPDEAVAMSGVHPQECNRYGFPQAIINRCLGQACPRWVGQADVLMLWQGNVPATPLLELQDAPFTNELNGSQLPNVMGTGPRTAILLNIDRCHAIEANYFNAGNFSGTRDFVAPAADLAWTAIGQLPNVGYIDGGTASMSGRIQSFELNWRRYNGRSLTWLAGFRWIEWNDSFTMTDTFTDPSTDPASTGIDTVSARSANDLYGGQIGVDATLLTLFDVIRFNGVAKAGVYGNLNPSSTMTVESTDPNRFTPTTYTATGKSTGFFGEVGVNGTVRLTEHLFWRAGYNFFWISGVATSLNQLQAIDMTVPSGALNLGGSVFLHGVNTGIEAVW